MNRSPENLLFTSINPGKQGEQNHNAKLSSVKVYELCLDYINGFPGKALAEKYDIHFQNVYRVIRNTIWKSIERPAITKNKIKQNKQYLINYFTDKIKQCNNS